MKYSQKFKNLRSPKILTNLSIFFRVISMLRATLLALRWKHPQIFYKVKHIVHTLMNIQILHYKWTSCMPNPNAGNFFCYPDLTTTGLIVKHILYIQTALKIKLQEFNVTTMNNNANKYQHCYFRSVSMLTYKLWSWKTWQSKAFFTFIGHIYSY